MEHVRVLGDRYRLDRLLGRGGMAEVFAGEDLVLQRPIAVKVLLHRFTDDDGFVERFRLEARNAARLNHPNIVAAYDTGSDDGVPYIVMEQVVGRSLADAIRAGGVTEDRALQVSADVCSALAYAHSQGLVHRDVKPGNILLGDDGVVKVTDFGIARAIDADTVTKTAAVLGTAAYLSPEQAQGQRVDERSDVYSLGVVLYEALTRSQPFTGDSPVTVAYQHVQEDPRPPRDIDGSITPASEAIVLRAMAKNPANRYGSAAELRADLLRARAGQPVTAPARLPHEETARLDAMMPNNPDPQGPRGTRAVVYALLGLLSLAAAFGAFWFLGSMLSGEEARRVTVPDVTNIEETTAKDNLDRVGLQAVVAGSEFSDDIAAGRVVRQEPPHGDQVSPETVVRLYTSRGREQVSVPLVTGLAEEEALQLLRDAGLVPITRSTEFSDDVAPGLILRTDPAAGERVARGTQVNWVVSAGEELVRVRSVAGLDEFEALRLLEEQEFQVLVVREFSDTTAEGFVVRQDPEPGTELPTGSEVTIVVSKGAENPEPEPEPSPTESDDGPIILPPPSPDPDPEPSPTPTPTAEAPTQPTQPTPDSLAPAESPSP